MLFRGDDLEVGTARPPNRERAGERMRRLMELVRHGRLDLTPLLTHTFSLENITEAYKIFGGRREGVIKIAIKP